MNIVVKFITSNLEIQLLQGRIDTAAHPGGCHVNPDPHEWGNGNADLPAGTPKNHRPG